METHQTTKRQESTVPTLVEPTPKRMKTNDNTRSEEVKSNTVNVHASTAEKESLDLQNDAKIDWSPAAHADAIDVEKELLRTLEAEISAQSSTLHANISSNQLHDNDDVNADRVVVTHAQQLFREEDDDYDESENESENGSSSKETQKN